MRKDCIIAVWREVSKSRSLIARELRDAPVRLPLRSSAMSTLRFGRRRTRRPLDVMRRRRLILQRGL